MRAYFRKPSKTNMILFWIILILCLFIILLCELFIFKREPSRVVAVPKLSIASGLITAPHSALRQPHRMDTISPN